MKDSSQCPNLKQSRSAPNIILSFFGSASPLPRFKKLGEVVF